VSTKPGAVQCPQLRFTTTVPKGQACGRINDDAAGEGAALTPYGGTGPFLECGTLYLGGGLSFQPPIPFPGGATVVFNTDCSEAPFLRLLPATSRETRGVDNCTAAGCFFGPPLPILNNLLPEASLCVVSSIAGAPAVGGNLDATTGTSTVTLPLRVQVRVTGDLQPDPGIQPCPTCTGGTCDSGANSGEPCTSTTSLLTSHDCLPSENTLAPFLVDLSPLTTGSAIKRVAEGDGFFCRPQTCTLNVDCGAPGAFGDSRVNFIETVGAPAGDLTGGALRNAIQSSVFCVPKSGSFAVDFVRSLPGPGAATFTGRYALSFPIREPEVAPVLAKIVTGAAGVGDAFGTAAVAVGSGFLIGAPFEDVSGIKDSGAAYLFEGDPASGIFDEEPVPFLNPAPGVGDRFGAAVAALGNDVAIGAPLADPNLLEDAGAVYLFDAAGPCLIRDGTACRPIVGPNARSGEYFGAAVTGAGNNVVVGAPAPLEDLSGSAYRFDRSGGLRATYHSPDPSAGDQFGAAVAALGPYVLVGAPFDDSAAFDAGAVYLFDENPQQPGVGRLRCSFRKPEPMRGDLFGAALAAVGTTVIIGAPFDDSMAVENAGAAYVFVLDPENPSPDGTSCGTLVQVLQNASTPTGDALFGAALAIAGTRAFVGAPFERFLRGNLEQVSEAGAVHVFEVADRDPSPEAAARAAKPTAARQAVASTEATAVDAETTFPLTTLRKSSPANLDHFGMAVAAAGVSTVVGTPGDDLDQRNDQRDAGVAYLFAATCGDGGKASFEDCDDGDLVSGNGCSNACTVEPGFRCCDENEPGGISICEPACDAIACPSPTIDPLQVSALETCECFESAGDPCDDGIACNNPDFCQGPGLSCVGTPVDSNCDDGEPCTRDRCDPRIGCINESVVCPDDGDPCTKEFCDRADGGACKADELPCTCKDVSDCPDPDCAACVLCEGCKNYPRSCCDRPKRCEPNEFAIGPCDDGNACTTGEACHEGRCLGGQPRECNDGRNPCTVEICDPVLGCVSREMPNGTSCSDDDACTINETCQSGRCTGQPTACPARSCNGALDCDDGNACTHDECAPAGCSNDKPDEEACPAHAIGAEKLLVKAKAGKPSKNKLTFVASGTFTPPLGRQFPTDAGATLEIRDGAGQQIVFPLPPEGWRAPGKVAGAKGFTYKDKGGRRGPCRAVRFDQKKAIKAVCKGAGVALALPLAEPVRVVLRSGTRAAGMSSYCAEFGGVITKNAGGKFFATGADAPVDCAP